MAQVQDASTVPVPDVSPEEEALLFGSQGQPTASAGGATLLRRLQQLQLKLMLRLLEAKWVEDKLEMALVKATSKPSWRC